MNRNEAIEQAANEIAMALTRKGYVNIKNGKDEPRIDALYKALAMPKDAERVALVRDVEVWLEQLGKPDCGNTLLFERIRNYLGGDA